MEPIVWEAQWREIFERHSTAAVSEFSAGFQDLLHGALTEAEHRNRVSVQRETAENLNQIIRRLRQASSREDVFTALGEATQGYCDRAGVFLLSGDYAIGVAQRGFESDLHISLSDAAAFRSAVETRDPVVAVAGRGEISGTLVDILGPNHRNPGGISVYLFPLVVRHEVVALLFAAGANQPAALELLSEAAALQLESLSGTGTDIPQAGPVTSGLVTIGGVKPPDAPATIPQSGRSAWENLSPEDQALHLRAQRFARVKVAELRLYRADAVREGRNNSNLYSLLRREIDAAREIFLRDFIHSSATMVDYVHLEMLRTLAHDKAEIIGTEYPGPLV